MHCNIIKERDPNMAKTHHRGTRAMWITLKVSLTRSIASRMIARTMLVASRLAGWQPLYFKYVKPHSCGHLNHSGRGVTLHYTTVRQ